MIHITKHALERFKERYKNKFDSLPRNICRTMRHMFEESYCIERKENIQKYLYNDMFEFVVDRNKIITFIDKAA